jgi:hypothetical protein
MPRYPQNKWKVTESIEVLEPNSQLQGV